MGRIVVGIDGSDASRHALRFALRTAERRRATLDAVLVHHRPPFVDVPLYGIPAMTPGSADLAEKQARATLDRVLDDESAGGRHRAVPVDRLVVEGAAAPTLLRIARGADLLVVGTSGRGWLLGSVSHHCVTHAACPVAVVPVPREGAPPRRADAPVVVGVDGSDGSKTALAWAAAEATDLGAPLHVVLVVPAVDAGWGFVDEPDAPSLPGPEETEAAAARRLDGFLVGELSPGGLQVHAEVLAGRPAERLAEAAEEGALLVLGSRGLGDFRGMLLGSVSQRCVHHATGPVVVVPEPEQRRG